MDAKDFYLYAKFPESLFRLNLSKVRDTNFELVHDFRSGKYPKGMGFLIVDSKPYMFGGARLRHVVIDQDGDEFSVVKEEHCLEAYELDPSNPQGPLVPVSGPIPKFSGPKVRPTVATIDGKTYVLTKPVFNGSLYDVVGVHFEVFDHVEKTWECLEDPPVFGSGRGKRIISCFAWGHRILIRTLGGFCIFDTRKSTWEDGQWFMDQLWPVGAPLPIGNAVEVEGGFYIALSMEMNALGAYEFDPDGVIKSYRVLDEFSGVFSTVPEFLIESFMGFVAEVGDGRLCLGARLLMTGALCMWHSFGFLP